MTCHSIAIPDLVAAVERGLRAQAERDPWGQEHLHCSDMGDALPDGCLRRVWLRINGHPKNPDDLGKLWRFARGNQVHESLTPVLKTGLTGTGWEILDSEIPLGRALEELFGVEKGSMDLGLLHYESSCAIAVDYKTIKTSGLARLSAPKEDNVIQVQGYMEAWQAVLGEDWHVLGGVLVYVDREGQGGFKSFFVRRDRAAVEAAAEKLRFLRGMEQPPPGPPPQGWKENWRCEYRTRDGEVVRCPYFQLSCPGSLALAAEAAGAIDLVAALKASLEEKGEGA